MFEVKKYDASLSAEWDQVVNSSKNGNFLHLSQYFRYHEDRFDDASLIIYKKNRPVAVFPANRIENTIYSHSGLTYAGLIFSKDVGCSAVLSIFDVLKIYYNELGASSLVYKCIPSVFTSYPAEEDLYALFRNDAKLFRRDVSSVVEIANAPKLSDSRKCVIRKAEKNSVSFSAQVSAADFHALLSKVLERFDSKPVHSVDELELLISRFPDEIKLYGAVRDNNLLAGALVFDFGHIVHTQYLAASDVGRQVGALDFVLNNLISNVYCLRKYFSFGISTEDAGTTLNEGLISQKEGFGARAVVHDFYRMEL
ncbi:GNAT family N-acetyltransferase [Pseudomonas sp. KHB2.9]